MPYGIQLAQPIANGFRVNKKGFSMPQYHPPDYADNTDHERQMHTILQQMLRIGERRLDIASGFFEPAVWRLLGDDLRGLESFRLLLGRPPELVNPDTDAGIIDLRRFYRERLREDLETLPLNRDYAHLVDELVAFLTADHAAVRYFNGAFLHAKAYITDHYAIVGSSNFTPSGMTRTAELNLIQQTGAVVRDLRDNWYERMWANATDSKAELIAALRESKFGDAQWTPHDVFIKVLYEYFKDRIIPDNLDARMGVELASFQQEGLREAIRLIDRHGGVIVSDAVGLGKTYIGMSLLEHYVLGKRKKGHIPRGLVVCPAQLRDLVWEPKLNEYGIKAEVISQEAVSRESFDWRTFNRYDVVLIDESHNFRNPGTNRYQNLMKMLATGKQETIVILLTATPVNNSIWDLYHQAAFITRGQDAFFREYGINNLRSFFNEVQEGGADVFTLLEQMMVRRSRMDIKRRQEAGEEIHLPGKGVIRFPDRKLHTVNYDLAGTYDGFYQRIVKRIESLALISFNIEQFRREEQVDDEVERVRQYSNALIGLLKTLYLKRLESSLEAFEVSIQRQREYQQRFYDYLVGESRLLNSSMNRRLLALEAQGDDLAPDNLQAIVDKLPEVDIDGYYIGELRKKLRDDIQTLDAILEDITLIRTQEDETQRDAKLTQLKRLLSGDLCGQKVIVFSYYQDTAQYIFEALCDDLTWQSTWPTVPVIEAVHGSVDGQRREALVKRFAPIANATPENPAPIDDDNPEIDILISTDVLSEGQNLQDAGVIINYDLHWTPIRMIQRAGRIDRLGTAFSTLRIYNCFPQDGLETMLNLVQRLQDRIRDIDRTVGLDASILGEAISVRSLSQLRRLRDADQTLIDELEREIELVSTDEMKLPLVVYLQQMGLEKVQSIPRGIGSGIAPSHHRPKGVFFAFQAGDRHFWRLYTAEGEVIKDKRRLYRYIFVPTPDTEKRVLPPNFEVYDMLDEATRDVIKEINKALRARRVKPKLGAINRELAEALRQASLLSVDDTAPEASVAPSALREQVQTVVDNISLDAFKRDKRLKEIRDAYSGTKNQRELVEALDEFFIENELYRDVPVTRTTLEEVHEEDLQLVAYEVFG
ncbi:MAG: helicase [Anaerolineaceae bacterium]|nr:MAG: helicase [Anaerolineaceae bacterium]